MLRIREKRGAFGGFLTAKKDFEVPLIDGAPVWDYIDDKYKAMEVVDVRLNGRGLTGAELHTRIVVAGDRLTLTPIGGWVTFFVTLLVSVALKIGEYNWKKHDAHRRRETDTRAALGPTYALDVAQNSYGDGRPCPWVMGECLTGGIVAGQYTDQYDEGIARQNTLLVVSHGPVHSISECHIDGNLIANYTGATLAVSLGTNDQAALPGFREANTTIGLNNQLLADAAFVVLGTASAESFILKIYFPSGVYHIDGGGRPHSIEWVAQIRYREKAGPGAWQDLHYPTTTTYLTNVNQDSDAGQARLYIVDSDDLKSGNVGDPISINYGGPRWETKIIAAVGIGYVDLTANLDYDHPADLQDLVWLASTLFRFKKRTTSDWAIWIPGRFPSADTYDIEITRRCPNSNGVAGASNRDFYDSYLREYQQISQDGIRHVGLAMAAVQAVASGQLTGTVGRYTFKTKGVITNPISSATLAGTPVYTRDPGALILLLAYNREQGLGNEVDSLVDLTMTATGLEYTVGELVTGPASVYQFRGKVISWDGATEKLSVEVENGFPHGNLTGATSGKVAAVSSVDECYGCDFPSLRDATEFSAVQVPDGTTGTTVNGNSNSGQKVLQVADTDALLVDEASTTVYLDSAAGQKILSVVMTGADLLAKFKQGAKVLLNSGGAREETAEVDLINASGQLIMVDNLTHPHTQVQADDVEKIHTSVSINFEGDRAEVGTIDTMQGGTSITLEDNLTFTHTAGEADEVHRAENRAYFDFVWDGNEDGWSALERIGKCCRLMIIPNNGSYIKVVPLRAETPIQLVCMSNIRRLKQPGEKGPGKSTFKIDWPETGRRPNKLTLEFVNNAQGFIKDYATIEDQLAKTNGEKIIHSRMEAYGISRSSQAHREAQFRLNLLRYTGRPIQYGMGQECLDFEVADVYRFAHDVPGYATGSGRVKAGATTTVIPLDHEVTVVGGEALRIRFIDDTQDVQVITNAAGSHKSLTVGVALAQAPLEGASWALGTLAQYRLVAMKMDMNLHSEMQSIEDDPALYSEKHGVIPAFSPTTLPDPDEMPPDVEGVTLTEAKIATQDRGIVNAINVHFRKPEHPSDYKAEIWMRERTDQRRVIGAVGWVPGTGNEEFDHPRGICVDPVNGHVYVADERNGRVIKYTLDLVYVDEVGGLSGPFDLCTDGTYLYIVESLLHRINIRLCADLTLHGTYGTRGGGNDQFLFPCGICTEDGSTFWVADAFNHRVKRCTLAVGVPTFAAHVGAQGAGDAQFERPMGIDVDPGGNYILLADTGNHRIKKHDAFGAMGYVSQIGSYHVDAGDDHFYHPMDVAIKGNWDKIFVADLVFNRIHRREGSDLSLIEITGGPEAGKGRDQFDRPRGLAFDETTDPRIYVVEYGNNRAQFRNDGQADMEDWERIDETADQRYTITSDFPVGELLEVAVVSVSPTRVKKHASAAPSSTITATGLGDTPPDVANAYAAWIAGQFRVWWDSVNCPDLLGYEVRTGSGGWLSGHVEYSIRAKSLEKNVKNTTEIMVAPPPAKRNVTFMVKAVTTTGQYSATEATVDVQNPTVFLAHVQPVTHSVSSR